MPEGFALVVGAPRLLWLLVALPLLAAPLLRGRVPLAALALRAIAFTVVVLAAAGLSIERREPAERLCVVVAASPPAGALAGTLSRDLAAALGPRDVLGAIAFGGEVVRWPAAPPRAAAWPEARGEPVAWASGIDAALPLCPEDVDRRIVLVGSGSESTIGFTDSVELAREEGAQVYVVAPGEMRAGAIALDKLVVPPMAREGSAFPLRLVFRNHESEEATGEVVVTLDGEPTFRSLVTLVPGTNVIEVPHRIVSRGSYRVEARLVGGGVRDDVAREASLTVAGPLRVLLVSEAKTPVLAAALRRKDVDLEVRRPGDLPGLEELLAFHCVILEDVPHRALDSGALDTLEAYVRELGGGLVATGGPRSFGDRAYRGSALERLLPVRFVEQKPPPKGRAPMGVFLLVDRSNSMGFRGTERKVRDPQKMRYAIQAAHGLLGQLHDEDRVGVIAFDSDPYVIGSLRPLLHHRSVLERRISRLVPGGGTDFKEALQIAAAQLADSGLGIRHVILLTDGDSNRAAEDHDEVLATMARLGITVTAIRVGDDESNLELLLDIAKRTGGRFYHVRDFSRLPQLLVRETREAGKRDEPAGGDAESRAGYAPRLGDPSEILRGFEDEKLPVVRRPVRAERKEQATEILYVIEGKQHVPLLAAWQAGLGRAVAFPFDPAGEGAEQWVSWPGFGKLWSQIVRWVVREETPWEVRSRVVEEDGLRFLEVRTFGRPGEEGDLAAELVVDEGPVTLPLTPTGLRRFRAPLPALPPGKIPVVYTLAGREVTRREEILLSPEGSIDESGGDVFYEAAARTGGAVNPSVDRIVERGGARIAVRHRLDVFLLVLALVCATADIAVRRRG